MITVVPFSAWAFFAVGYPSVILCAVYWSLGKFIKIHASFLRLRQLLRQFVSVVITGGAWGPPPILAGFGSEILRKTVAILGVVGG